MLRVREQVGEGGRERREVGGETSLPSTAMSTPGSLVGICSKIGSM